MPDYADNDEHLLQAVGQGDLNSFGKIVERHQEWAWRIAYRFFGDENEAADVVQDAFMRLLDSASRYRPEAKFRTFFHRIITRLCLDRAKKKKPLYLDTLPDLPDHRLDAAEVLMRRETAVAVRQALDALAPNQRMAIVLRYYEDLNYEEIAAALDTSPKAVERLLGRGRERLRDLLGNREFFFRL
ncbi:MAG: RNA polymerase sigma factor [Thermodesulfobacteriota bacterium]